jgi:hypothetical protein
MESVLRLSGLDLSTIADCRSVIRVAIGHSDTFQGGVQIESFDVAASKHLGFEHADIRRCRARAVTICFSTPKSELSMSNLYWVTE